MDVSIAIRQRLDELGLEQRELATAAQVTESYISQLLTRRRMPPAPGRTDIYERMEKLLRLPRGELATLATHQRRERLKKELVGEPAPRFGDVRALILRKCHPARERAVRAVFEKEPFGELERLVTRTILNLVKRITRNELTNEEWLRTVARLSGRSYREMRSIALEFLDTDILHVSPENCAAFLEPLIKSWDVDLQSFDIDIRLHPRVSRFAERRFQFTEHVRSGAGGEPGFVAFMRDRSLSGFATADEIAYLERLEFAKRRPTALYYYRELQSLRDPLHFAADDASPGKKGRRRTGKRQTK